MFVTAYRITRHYGGPEEGGWWYNWYTPVDSITVLDSDPHGADATALVEFLESRWLGKGSGNLYSVNGGHKYEVLVEESRHEFASVTRPHYE